MHSQTNTTMRIIARKRIVDYYTIHPQAKVALDDWYKKTEEAEWNSLADIKQTFNSVDFVGNQHYVFCTDSKRSIQAPPVVLRF